MWAGQSQLPHVPKNWWEGTDVPQPPIPTAGICQGAPGEPFWGAEVTFASPFSELGSSPFSTVVFVCRAGFQRHNTHGGKSPCNPSSTSATQTGTPQLLLHSFQSLRKTKAAPPLLPKPQTRQRMHKALLDELLSALTCRCFRKSRAICTFCRRWKRIRPFSRGCKTQGSTFRSGCCWGWAGSTPHAQ